MSGSMALIAVVVASLGTYLARGGLILLLANRTLPAPVERALQNVAPAVLAALTINLAITSDGQVSLPLAEMAALVVACVVAIWRRNLLWTLAAGMSTLWIITAVT